MSFIMLFSLVYISRMGCFSMRLLFQKYCTNSWGIIWKQSSSSWKICFISQNIGSILCSANLSWQIKLTIFNTSLLRALKSLIDRVASKFIFFSTFLSKDDYSFEIYSFLKLIFVLIYHVQPHDVTCSACLSQKCHLMNLLKSFLMISILGRKKL